MPMPSGRKIRPPIQAPLTTLPTNLTVCGQSSAGRYYGGLPRGGTPVTAHAHTQPIPSPAPAQPAQPPLITETLTACLDVDGTYICTSYSPRCYIIQKVTANSLRVSPSGVLSGGGTSRSLSPGFPQSISSSVDGGHQSPISEGLDSSSGGQGPRRRVTATKSGSPDVMYLEQLNTRATPHQPITSSKRGNNCMNCEVGITGRTTGLPGKSTGDDQGVPPMGVVSQMQCTLNSASYVNDTRSLNGYPSGPRDEMMSAVETRGSGPTVNSSGNFLQGITNNNEQTSSDASAELRQTVLAQLEYYFSPDNLSTDKFLVSQMDSDQYVYISTIANFNMIKKLSSDLDLITDVLRESKHVQVHPDGKRVRPVSNRTVVIVRGIPDTTSIEEIKALFEKENSPRCNHCEFAFNDSWYLSFDSDDEAMRAHRYLREEVREFKGQPIMARIKSRPTTLLGPGMGMGMGVNPTNLKNGFHQPSVSLPTYITAAPYVPVSQTGGSTAAVSTTPIYATPQQVSSTVFTMPQNPYGPFNAQMQWGPGFYELNSALTPLYMNGLPSQNHTFQKATPHQMLPRHRTSKSESESFNGPPQPRGPRRTNANGNIGTGDVNGIHMYNNQRKSTSHGGGALGHPPPAPLLAMAPPQAQLPNHISSHSHNHHNSNLSSTPMNNSTGSQMSRNGQLHYSSLPPQSVPHVHSESFHRPYRTGDRDIRPRSSLGVRRGGPPRSRDEEGSYEGNNLPATTVSSTRRFPSTRGGPAPPPPSSPQPPVQVSGTNHTAVQTTLPNKFDLEVSSFPPLPGASNPASKNGDSPYEGRLSDVVKGVKSLKVTSTVSSTEKDEFSLGAVSKDAVANHNPRSSSAEIVVSAGGGDNPTSAIYVVSAASPTRELEGSYKEKGTDPPSPPSQASATVSPSAVTLCSKKEFREVGVGSADDNQEVCASNSKELFVSGTRIKETADKSTQSVIVKTTSTSTVPTPTHAKPFSGATENNSKKGPRPAEDLGAEKKDSPTPSGESGKKTIDESCSTEDREGPVRLSYAQVAQRTGAGAGTEKVATAPPNVASTPASPGDDGKRGDSGRGGSRDGKEGPRQPKSLGSGPPPRSAPVYKRPPFPRRDRVFSNGSANRMGSSGGSSMEHKN